MTTDYPDIEFCHYDDIGTSLDRGFICTMQVVWLGQKAREKIFHRVFMGNTFTNKSNTAHTFNQNIIQPLSRQ